MSNWNTFNRHNHINVKSNVSNNGQFVLRERYTHTMEIEINKDQPTWQ